MIQLEVSEREGGRKHLMLISELSTISIFYTMQLGYGSLASVEL